MLIYGDPSFYATPAELAALLESRRRAFEAAPGDLDAARALLVAAGQVEQAVADAAELPADCPAAAEAVTDEAAGMFVRALFVRAVETARSGAAEPPQSPPGYGTASVLPVCGAHRGRRPLSEPFQRLEQRGLAAVLPAAPLTVKVPEGFAFYALYPEQYAAAADRWADDHADAPEKSVAVVGVRSIGTTLSAVVAAALARRGWRANRFTVRPTGHPFARVAEVTAEQVRGAAWALVVDEGPGQSGSSMAAVAAALGRAGVPAERIAFLPGHGGEPGGAASEEVRERWARTPRYVVSREELRWGGRSLTEVLADRTRALCGAPADAPVTVEDFGGGLWRRHVFGEDVARWPVAFAPFERPKYRVRLGADGPAVLWAFCGFAEVARAGVESLPRPEEGMTVAPADSALGWVGFRWVEGQPLAVSDGSAETLAHVGRYVRAAAGPPMTPAEVEEGRVRLADVLYWNVWEGVGEQEAERARVWSEHIAAEIGELPEPLRVGYGDGRLAPHEWIRTPDGRLVKTDASGHDADHTCVGRQPVLWDLAGAVVEWGLTGGGAGPLLTGFAGAVPIETLRWYTATYAAFRLGMAVMCAGLTADSDERARLEGAAEFYRRAVRDSLPV